jgi:hypothetical protein
MNRQMNVPGLDGVDDDDLLAELEMSNALRQIGRNALLAADLS